MTLLEIRELKAAYRRAIGTLRAFERLAGMQHSDGVEILHSEAARKVERQRRVVFALERRLREAGVTDQSIEKLAPRWENISNALYL